MANYAYRTTHRLVVDLEMAHPGTEKAAKEALNRMLADGHVSTKISMEAVKSFRVRSLRGQGA